MRSLSASAHNLICRLFSMVNVCMWNLEDAFLCASLFQGSIEMSLFKCFCHGKTLDHLIVSDVRLVWAGAEEEQRIKFFTAQCFGVLYHCIVKMTKSLRQGDAYWHYVVDLMPVYWKIVFYFNRYYAWQQTIREIIAHSYGCKILYSKRAVLFKYRFSIHCSIPPHLKVGVPYCSDNDVKVRAIKRRYSKSVSQYHMVLYVFGCCICNWIAQLSKQSVMNYIYIYIFKIWNKNMYKKSDIYKNVKRNIWKEENSPQKTFWTFYVSTYIGKNMI